MKSSRRADPFAEVNLILLYLGLGIGTLLLGLAVRFLPVGIPFVIVREGGSALWAAMVYWLLSALLPTRGRWIVAVVAGVMATLVELLRLYHSPGLDGFRLTLAGALLLGRVFSSIHIFLYWAAIVGAWALDRRWISKWGHRRATAL